MSEEKKEKPHPFLLNLTEDLHEFICEVYEITPKHIKVSKSQIIRQCINIQKSKYKDEDTPKSIFDLI